MESQLSTPRDLEESSPCEDEGHESSVSLADDDDETLPIWFRQISSETVDTVVSHFNSYLKSHRHPGSYAASSPRVLCIIAEIVDCLKIKLA